ncbi:MAG: Ig-like domain-containing protein, partial [Clostridia bacterium]|nr:Ig-like domain-containing protein [Clostridia bacterium]
MSIRSKNLVLIFCLLILVSFPISSFAEQKDYIKSIYFSVSEQYQLYEPKPTAEETISLRPGGNVLLYPRAIYTNGEDKLISDVVWKISDPQVVSIDQDFMLKGIKEGTATVAASYGSHTVS